MGLLPMDADILPPSDDRVFELILTWFPCAIQQKRADCTAVSTATMRSINEKI